jgi:hypothetical protein
MIYCGIDNGVSGSIGFVSENNSLFILTPTKLCTNYQKKAKQLNRIDFQGLRSLFSDFTSENIKVFLERPLVNPGRFEATASALRAFEATIICLEELGLPYEYIDSKQWQKKLLPEGLKGSQEQKKASMDVGMRMFPQFAEAIRKHKDADGILIAEWARRERL